MTPLFKKLNLKEQRQIVVLQAPASFEPELAALKGVEIVRSLFGQKRGRGKPAPVEFFLGFVTKQSEVDEMAPKVAGLAEGDAVVWFAYPKGTSKKYRSEINRDRGWQALGDAGFEPVRQVAIDEDWSATRFRRVEFIKTMTRAAKHRISARRG